MRRWQASVSAICSAMMFLGGALPARAFEPVDPGGLAPTPPAASGTEQAVVAQYWELGRPRWFGAMTLEAGYAYAKPQFSAGYGQPFWRWFGVQAYPLGSVGGVGQYAGIGAGIPGLSARVGGRYFYPFQRRLLPPRESYTREDMQLEEGPRGDYLALEAEISATLPMGRGSLFGVLTGYRVELVPDGLLIYEESLRTIMKPPHIWRTRLGYLLSLGQNGAIRIGPVSEVVGMPGRYDVVLRGGLLTSVLINAHLEAQASFIPVLTSPDSLGLAGGDFGQLGVLFRWATGSTPDPDRVRQLRGEQEPVR